MVHEFAKLRWGVFEEHGYPGDKKFPMFYLKTEWSMSGQKTSVTPNFCVNSELRGYEQVFMYSGDTSRYLCTQGIRADINVLWGL